MLQNKKTGAFLAAESRWVSDITLALVFNNSVEAQKHAYEESLSDVRILIRPDNGPDIFLPC